MLPANSDDQSAPLVLIVDDDEMLREIMRISLEDAGFRVEESCDGKAGLAAFSSVCPDILLLDVMMPEMNGFEVCEKIRSHPDGLHFPIIMVTGLDDTESIDRAYEAGATDFITKPLNSAVLGHRVRYILRASAAEREVSFAHARLQDAIESIPADLTIYDAEDRLIMGNSRVYEHNPELTEQLLPGSAYETLLHAAARCGVVPAAAGREEIWVQERLAQHAADETTFEEQRRDGKWVQVYERRTSEGGTVNVGVDITGLKEREQALEEARIAAESADRAKSEFLAMTSHELRTPLNAILGFAEMIITESFGPLGNDTYEEYLGNIHQSGKHLLDVVNDILDMSKIEAGKLEMRPELIDVPHLLANWIRIFEPQAAEENISLTMSIPDTVPEVHGDSRIVKKMLLNLLSNAFKFTESGGTVTVDVQYIAEEKLTISVVDSGIGISDENLQRVLMPFAQVDGTLARKYEGTGLGLSLTKAMIELHGGSIELKSAVGVGTTVSLHFPLGQAEEQPAYQEIA